MIKSTRELVHSDGRGEIFDLITDELISSVSFITFTHNAIRGNHIHSKTSQWNYVVSGEIFVIIDSNGNREEATFHTGDLFLIPPGEAHAMRASESSELMVFTMGPRGGKDFESDTFRLESPLI